MKTAHVRSHVPLIALLTILAPFAIRPAAAQELDPHRIYEQRCARCHSPHAGPFVNEKLAQTNGSVVIGSTSGDLKEFLSRGHGRLASEEVAVLIEHFRNILSSAGLFQEKCRMCHDRAVELARHNLIEKDGRLVGRYSGRDIEKFLKDHGRLETEEIAKMIAALKRQLR